MNIESDAKIDNGEWGDIGSGGGHLDVYSNDEHAVPDKTNTYYLTLRYCFISVVFRSDNLRRDGECTVALDDEWGFPDKTDSPELGFLTNLQYCSKSQ